MVDLVSHTSSSPPAYVMRSNFPPMPPFASISSLKPDADEMLPFIDDSVVFFATIVVVVVALIDALFLFIFFDTAVTIITAWSEVEWCHVRRIGVECARCFANLSSSLAAREENGESEKRST